MTLKKAAETILALMEEHRRLAQEAKDSILLWKLSQQNYEALAELYGFDSPQMATQHFFGVGVDLYSGGDFACYAKKGAVSLTKLG